MSKNLQRRKPGYTRAGDVRIVSLNGPQLATLSKTISKKKTQAKIQRRMQILGYQAPEAAEDVASE